MTSATRFSARASVVAAAEMRLPARAKSTAPRMAIPPKSRSQYGHYSLGAPGLSHQLDVVTAARTEPGPRSRARFKVVHKRFTGARGLTDICRLLACLGRAPRRYSIRPAQ